jgi:hypothetical protein
MLIFDIIVRIFYRYIYPQVPFLTLPIKQAEERHWKDVHGVKNTNRQEKTKKRYIFLQIIIGYLLNNSYLCIINSNV